MWHADRYHVNARLTFVSSLWSNEIRYYASKCLSTLALVPCQALTQLQAEIDNAMQLVKSSSEHNAIDLETSTAAKKRLETALRSLPPSEGAAGSPVVVAARKLISDLDVRA